MRYYICVLTSTLFACGSNVSPEVFEEVDEIIEEEVTHIPRPVEVTEDFRVVYGYQGRIPGPSGNTHLHDLFVMDPRGIAKQVSLTKTLANTGLNCNLGCFVDAKLKALAVVTEQDGPGTYKVRIARLDKDLSPYFGDFPDITQVRYLRFGKDSLYWSSPQLECQSRTNPPSNCFSINKIAIENPSLIERLFSFPPPDALAGSQFQGSFVIGEDGESLVLLNPTNVSQTLYVWSDGRLTRVGLPICAAPDPTGRLDRCGTSGTSSQFTDKDPVGLSADRRHLIYALIEGDQELRLYHDDLVFGTRTYSVLLTVPNGYTANACYNMLDWQYKAVLPPIRFTSDGKEVILLGYSDCGQNRDKPWTNLVRIAIDRIGTGKKLTENDLFKITDNPKGAIAACISITSFDLSPSGEYVVFLGTPTLESDGKTPIKDTDVRGRTSAEVYVTRTDGTALPVQLTNSLEFKATSVLAVGPL